MDDTYMPGVAVADDFELGDIVEFNGNNVDLYAGQMKVMEICRNGDKSFSIKVIAWPSNKKFKEGEIRIYWTSRFKRPIKFVRRVRNIIMEQQGEV